jgi:hypothetical protein
MQKADKPEGLVASVPEDLFLYLTEEAHDDDEMITR